MMICVFGVGGVWGYFGGRLAAAGNSVAFIALGETLEALQRDGLRVSSPLGDISLPSVEDTDDPAEVGEVDAVILGREAGVPTPVNGFIFATHAPLEARTRRAVITAG